MIEHFERPLTPSERRELEGRLASPHLKPWSSLLKTAVAGIAVCSMLAVLTLLASDAPRSVVLMFWSVVAIVLTLWIGLPGGSNARRRAAALRDALAHNRARGVRITSARVVEFEEIEDEGACFAFAVDDDRLVFILGQEFYADESFPNDDFSIVDVLSSNDRVVDMLIVKEGRKLEPQRVIAREVKDTLEIPDHLAVIAATIETVEQTLPPARHTRGASR